VGGHDGIADMLYGGDGKDRFKAEYYWVGLTKKNRDEAKDFNAALDLYFS
jgi:hypothetical protein